jgi:hypothetical protein
MIFQIRTAYMDLQDFNLASAAVVFPVPDAPKRKIEHSMGAFMTASCSSLKAKFAIMDIIESGRCSNRVPVLAYFELKSF